jgi:hypothetical protein
MARLEACMHNRVRMITDASPSYPVFDPVWQGWHHDPAGCPDPIVEHAAERRVALARYEQVRAGA